MIGLVIVAVAFAIAVKWQILENRAWNRAESRIREKESKGKRREFIFVEKDISEEHAGLVATDEEEEREALYWS